MSIPDYASCMLPLLRLAGDGQSRRFREAAAALAEAFALTEKEQKALLPGGSPVFLNRAQWAATYLKKAGLLSGPQRGFLQITDRGRAVLQEDPPSLTPKDLSPFPEFADFLRSSRKQRGAAPRDETHAPQDERRTPEEALLRLSSSFRQRPQARS